VLNFKQEESMTSKNQRVCIITGATGAIGKAIALKIATTPGYSVVLVGRDENRTSSAALEIAQVTGNDQVRYEVADLSRQEEVRALADRWHRPLHVLVNNAAVTPRRRLETSEGIEMQFATNVMGYFWMSLFFEDLLAASAPSRIVNVASYWAGDLDIHDLEFRHRPYQNGTAYRQSKQANRMLTAAFSRRFFKHGIAVNVCHPGDVNSNLSSNLGFGGHETPSQGADTPAWLATSSTGQTETGRYFENRRAVNDPFSKDESAVEALYDKCLSYCS
jgi:NAD(P)-dependent dehydrogenase (short-subunit alcohol dehydrogenase family)